MRPSSEKHIIHERRLSLFRRLLVRNLRTINGSGVTFVCSGEDGMLGFRRNDLIIAGQVVLLKMASASRDATWVRKEGIKCELPETKKGVTITRNAFI
jgi:hypothetical protein